MRTRRQYLVETLSNGRIDVCADHDVGGVIVELHRSILDPVNYGRLTPDQAAELIRALDKALTDLDRPGLAEGT